ncbi:ROK family protein [Sulfuricurvum sp.]|uniref:ROK family protein n=1 Tax=Sulfuricurvum sp. TaxID=2025608 RepID=UPI003BAFF202
MKTLTIDIGGTYLRSELHSGSEIFSQTIRSDAQGLLSFIEEQMAAHPDIGFIGISYAGQVYEGEILSAPNISIDEHRLKAVVESRYDVTLAIDNDLNCAIMAEAQHWGTETLCALYVGTGIGSAVIDGGRLIRGSGNLSFEIGHIPYRHAPFVCGCGRSNCIELFASGSGIAKWCTRLKIDEDPFLERLKHSSDTNAQMIVKEFETALLSAAGTLVTLGNPALLVLGGGIIRENPYLLKLLRERLGEFALRPSLQNLRIEISVLDNASMDGAKLLQERRYG